MIQSIKNARHSVLFLAFVVAPVALLVLGECQKTWE